MKKTWNVISLLVAALVVVAVLYVGAGRLFGDEGALILGSGGVLEERIAPPPGYVRVDVGNATFGAWLRRLPLKPEGTELRYADGRAVSRQNEHAAVVDLDVLRYQECADSILRLRAEYLRRMGREQDIAFHFTSGDLCSWTQWRQGVRPQVQGNEVRFALTDEPGDSDREFREYLETVFCYAGTLSLHRDAAPVAPADVMPGDIIVRPGSPGHAIIILDMAVNERGERVALLGQGFMPPVQFHVIRSFSPDIAPWHPLPDDMELIPVGWFVFFKPELLRFPEG